MIRLLHSGKFWLKTICIGSLCAVLLLSAGHIGLHYLFSVPTIHANLDKLTRHGGRVIRFDESRISRSLLPRPTLTLRDVSISSPDNAANALFIAETRIGFAWENFFTNHADIEKWVLKNAKITLNRSSDGMWNLQDLWQNQNHSAHLNRIIIEDSLITVNTPHDRYQISGFSFNSGNARRDSRPFSAQGVLHHAAITPFSWNAEGLIRQSGDLWQIPALRIGGETVWQGETLRISSDANLSWQVQNKRLRINNLRLEADTAYKNLHISAQSPLLIWQNGRLNAGETSALFTADLSDGIRWDGSLSLDNLGLRNSVATMGSFELKSSLKDSRLQTNIAVSGPLIWQRQEGFSSDRLHIVTHQDSTNRNHAPRLSSVLEGSFKMADSQNWQADFKGMFDKQPTAVVLRYSAPNGQAAKLEAGIALRKLSLEPYWQDLSNSKGLYYPAWLSKSWMPEIEAQLEIGALSSPSLQLDSLSTLLSANSDRIMLSNLKAELYGGQTEGGVAMAAGDQPTLHIQQHARNVQLRPILQDLFGFHRIQGRGNALIDTTTRGSDMHSLTRNLNGSLHLEVANGAWLGIDMDNILQSNTLSGKIGKDDTLQTPFHRFVMNSEIKDGIAYHDATELYSERLYISSSGKTDWNKREFAEELLIRHATNKNIPGIPLKISGAIDNPSVTLDFNRLTNGMHTPEEKQKALRDALKEQWKWLNPNRK